MPRKKLIANEPALISEVINDIALPKLMRMKRTRRKIKMCEERRKKIIATDRRKAKENRERLDYSKVDGYTGGEIDHKIPREIIHKMAKQHEDQYKWQKDPTKRKTWSEFCRDFIGQNHNAIAQAMLELFINDKEKFMRYIIEMGKAGYPMALMKEQSNIAIENKGDIYATLTAMSASSGQLPEGTPVEEPDVVQEEASDEEDDGNPNYDISLAANFADTSKVSELNQQKNLFEQFTKLNNNGKVQESDQG